MITQVVYDAERSRYIAYRRPLQDLPGLRFYEEHGRAPTRAEKFALIHDLAELDRFHAVIERLGQRWPDMRLSAEEERAYQDARRRLAR